MNENGYVYEIYRMSLHPWGRGYIDSYCMVRHDFTYGGLYQMRSPREHGLPSVQEFLDGAPESKLIEAVK